MQRNYLRRRHVDVLSVIWDILPWSHPSLRPKSQTTPCCFLCFRMLPYVFLFYFWDSWLVFQVAFELCLGMIHVESPDFPPSWCTFFFSKEMQLGKADEMEEVTHVFPCCHVFFWECVWELPVMSGFCFFNVQCYFGTIFTIYSPLMYYEWIHEIVGWWHHFPKTCSRNLWESVTFNRALLSFWTALYSLLERRD